MKNKIFLFLLLALLAAPALSTVNVNLASAQELASELKWIGEKKARAIIQYRKENGDFCSADDLLKIKGIGSRDVETNRALLVFSASGKAESAKDCANSVAPDMPSDPGN